MINHHTKQSPLYFLHICLLKNKLENIFVSYAIVYITIFERGIFLVNFMMQGNNLILPKPNKCDDFNKNKLLKD